MNPLLALLQANSRPRLPGPLDRLPTGVKAGLGVVAPLVPGLGPLASPGGQIGQAIAPHVMDNPAGKALIGALLAGVGRAGQTPEGRIVGEKMPLLALLGHLGYDAAAQQAINAPSTGSAFDRARAANEAAASGHEVQVGLANEAVNPINWLGPLGELAQGAKLGGLGRVLQAADRAQGLPVESLALLKGLAGRAAAREALAKVTGNVPLEELAQVGGKRQLGPIRPPEQFGYARGNVPGGRRLGPDLPPSQDVGLPPELGPALPERGNLPADWLIPGIGRNGGKGIGPILNPLQDVPLPPELGPAFPGRGNVPVDQLIGKIGRNGGRGIGPAVPPGPRWQDYGPETIHPGEDVTPELLDRFARLRENPNPTELDINAEIGAMRDPVTLAQEAYGDDWERRLSAITGGSWGKKDGAKLVNGRIILGDLDLTTPVRDYLENRGGARAGEFKGAIKALLPGDVPVYSGKPPEAMPEQFTGTIDDVRNLIAGEADRAGTMYPPNDPAFYQKRANVDPAQVPAMLDQLVQEGTLGRLPDGSLAVKPGAKAAEIAPTVAEEVAAAAPVPEVPSVSLAATPEELPLEVAFGKQSTRKLGKTTSVRTIAATLQRQGQESYLNPELLLRSYDGKVWDVVAHPTGEQELIIGGGFSKNDARAYAEEALRKETTNEIASPREIELNALISDAMRSNDMSNFNALMDERSALQRDRITLATKRVEDWRGRMAAKTPKPTLGGDLAAGGGGFGIVAPRLGTTAAGAALGGLAGAGIGAATDEDDRLGGAAKGAAIGAVAGGNLGSVSPEIGRAAQHVATALASKLPDTMLDPGMIEDGIRAGWRDFEARQGVKSPTGVKGRFDAFWSQQRAAVVNTLKQLPQDALQRAFINWGVAGKEFGTTGADFVRWQGILRRERASGTSSLQNPIAARFRRLGQESELAHLQDIYGIDYGGSLEQQQGQVGELSGPGRAGAGALIGAMNGAKTLNPVSIVYGAARGYAAPFVDGMIRFLNGIQHDSFRFAMAEKALDRDIPQLADKFLTGLAQQGVDVSSLAGHGGYFSPEEVAAIAGKQAGEDWRMLAQQKIRESGDRIAGLAGDFRDKLDPKYTGTVTQGDKIIGNIEKRIPRFIPFARWSIRYAPVLAEIAARHPVAAMYALREEQRLQGKAQAEGKKAYQAGYTISTEDPIVGGLIARPRLGFQQGTTTIDPISSVMPYGSMLGSGEELPEDATAYQRGVAALDRVGFGPNPVIQSLAYVTGQDYKAPSALSRTAGLEGLADTASPLARALLNATGQHQLANQVPDTPQIPSGRAALDAARKIITGSGGSDSTPEARRYAELVIARTGKPLEDASNRGYLETMGQTDNPLWQLAIIQSRAGAAAGNATGLVSPVQTTAQTSQARAAQAAPKLPYTSYEIGQAPKAQQPALRAANAKATALNPASATYVNISGKARTDELLARWDFDHQFLKKYTPALYAERRKEYAASLR